MQWKDQIEHMVQRLVSQSTLNVGSTKVINTEFCLPQSAIICNYEATGRSPYLYKVFPCMLCSHWTSRKPWSQLYSLLHTLHLMNSWTSITFLINPHNIIPKVSSTSRNHNFNVHVLCKFYTDLTSLKCQFSCWHNHECCKIIQNH